MRPRKAAILRTSNASLPQDPTDVRTPLQLARARGYRAMVEILGKAGGR